MQAETQTTEQVEYVVIDGIRWDAETGDCYGPDQAEPFAVTDEASADWVLEKMVDADLEVKRLEQKLKALQENLGAQLKKAKARQAGLLARFEGELEQFYLANPPKKGRTVQLTFGKLSMRTVPGGLRVRDESMALMFAQGLDWSDAIKVTTSFQVSALTPEQKEKIRVWLDQSPDEDPVTHTVAAQAFEIKPDEEKFSVKVGA